MYDDIQQTGRVGQIAYWVWFGASIVVTLALCGAGVYELASGAVMMGFVLLILILPLSIYFRVIMMRRCRDINWPAFLPWVSLGICVLAGTMSGWQAGATRQMPLSPPILPMILSLLDFAFVIVLGCIPTATSTFDYETEYEKYARDYGLKVTKTSTPADQTTAQLGARVIEPERPRVSFGRKNV